MGLLDNIGLVASRGFDGRGRGLRYKAIEGEEDYAGNKLGWYYRAAVLSPFHAKRNQYSASCLTYLGCLRSSMNW